MFFSFFVFLVFFGITIAAVTVLAIHKRLRPPVSTDCFTTGYTTATTGTLLYVVPLGLLLPPGTPAFPDEVILEC